jgi:hypothetical protein
MISSPQPLTNVAASLASAALFSPTACATRKAETKQPAILPFGISRCLLRVFRASAVHQPVVFGFALTGLFLSGRSPVLF